MAESLRVMTDIEGPLSFSALSLIGRVHIDARALRLRDIYNYGLAKSLALQWGEKGYFTCSNEFYLH
jgi:hypothetical protein